MEILKFNENIHSDKVFFVHREPIYQRIIDYNNSQGYKLYYYENFKLIEIESVGRMEKRIKWKAIWGDMVFFLNDSEYEQAMKVINTSKDLYDKHIKSANTVAKMPLSNIYHNILKIK